MLIRFWGTRGSIPAPGAMTLEFGGNTSCVEVLLDSGRRIVIDAGTGLRRLGEHLKHSRTPISFHLLLTHNHWDHLLGLPFFAPAYREDTEIIVDGWPLAFQAMTKVFDDHMGNGFFPVGFDQLKARVDFLNRISRGTLKVDEAQIDAIHLNHPQGGFGFRIHEGRATMVFITDNELLQDQGKRFGDFVNFVHEADLLIHDAQYLPEEMVNHQGWGHSTYEEVVTLALEGKVKMLLLTHHDPSRSDSEMRVIIDRARKLAASKGNSTLKIDGAREGATFQLS